MDGPPPPPPPHGEKPKTTHGEYRKASDLPEGNYDIFIIPPHSSGSGFLYLPSLQCQRNSFIAGSVSTLFVVFLWANLSPIVRTWYAATIATAASGGGMGIAILGIAMGFAGWAFGVSQADSGGTQKGSQWRSRFSSFGSGGFGFRGSEFGGAGAGGNSSNSRSSAGADHARGPNAEGYAGGQQGHYNGNFGAGTDPGSQYTGNQYGAGGPPPPNAGPPPTPPYDAGPSPNKPDSTSNTSESKSKSADWERERDETRRKEELRRKMEEFKRKREAEAREKQKQREREAMERELRERREQLEKEMAAAKEAAAKEARERAEREAAEARAKYERKAAEIKAKAEREAAEARVKAEREAAELRAKVEKQAAQAKEREERAKAKAEKEAAEAKIKAEKEAAEKEAAAKAAAKKEADAKFAALKEAAAKKYAEKKAKDAQEAAAKETAAKEAASKASSIKTPSVSTPPRTPSPKKPAARTATTTAADEEDAYSFRPYDRPRRPYANTAGSSVYSESSYAPSQSTAWTTPPPSARGTYSTKDPDKIVIKGVYSFNNAFVRTPVAQLVSGQGQVTDGLVLRITTEGLFIDDDVRGVPQREWDVKAWTLKLVEVWCPQYGVMAQSHPSPKPSNPFFRRSTDPTPEESDAYLLNLLKVCKNTCRLASPTCSSRNGNGINGSNVSIQTAEQRGLHVLRATVRDQEGRRYVFVLQDTEGWKVAIGLQRLRKGSMVRALGASTMAVSECRTTLENLGYV